MLLYIYPYQPDAAELGSDSVVVRPLCVSSGLSQTAEGPRTNCMGSYIVPNHIISRPIFTGFFSVVSYLLNIGTHGNDTNISERADRRAKTDENWDSGS